MAACCATSFTKDPLEGKKMWVGTVQKCNYVAACFYCWGEMGVGRDGAFVYGVWLLDWHVILCMDLWLGLVKDCTQLWKTIEKNILSDIPWYCNSFCYKWQDIFYIHFFLFSHHRYSVWILYFIFLQNTLQHNNFSWLFGLRKFGDDIF